MKKSFLLGLIALLCCGCPSHHSWSEVGDFKVDGIHYNILNANEVEVTFTSFGCPGPWSDYEGNIVIPERVVNKGKEYRVTTIGNMAFGRSNIISIILPEGLTTIRNAAFEGCRLVSISLPNSVTSIEEYAFAYCEKLEALHLPDNLDTIGHGAFMGCPIIEDLFIPSHVREIGISAFHSCPLRSITVAEDNTHYHSQGNCLIETATKTLHTGCANSIIPDDGSVTIIGEDAFADCKELSHLTIPNSVTAICNNAFFYCEQLTTLTIPNNVTYVGAAFYGCDKLHFNTYENLHYVGNDANPYLVLVKADSESQTSYTIHPNARFVAGDAFIHCKNLQSIVFPDAIQQIGNNACAGCERLSSVAFGNKLTLIEDEAFRGTALTDLVLPKDITTIGYGAFWLCDAIQRIVSQNPNPPTIQYATFLIVKHDIPVYVPDESVAAYKHADYWKDFTNIQPLSKLK